MSVPLFMPTPAGIGNLWLDAVDSDIVPTGADSTYDLGATAARFAEAYTDTLYLTDGTVTSDVADGAAANGFVFNTSNAFSTSGANLISVQNNGTEKLYVDKDGEIHVGGNSGTYLDAPNVNNFYLYSPFNISLVPTNASGQISLGAANPSFGFAVTDWGKTVQWGTGITDAVVLQAPQQDADRAISTFTIKGATAYASASTNLDGGNLILAAGAGASGSAGDADGGHLYLDAGQGYGTGDNGGIYIANTVGRLSFFAATPVAQQSGTGETTGFTAGTGTAVNDDSTFTGNVGSTAYRISDVVKALKNYGLLAS